jgi:hypothetical protein
MYHEHVFDVPWIGRSRDESADSRESGKSHLLSDDPRLPAFAARDRQAALITTCQTLSMERDRKLGCPCPTRHLPHISDFGESNGMGATGAPSRLTRRHALQLSKRIKWSKRDQFKAHEMSLAQGQFFKHRVSSIGVRDI